MHRNTINLKVTVFPYIICLKVSYQERGQHLKCYLNFQNINFIHNCIYYFRITNLIYYSSSMSLFPGLFDKTYIHHSSNVIRC